MNYAINSMICVTFISVVTALINVANTKRINRSQQVLYPVFAIVFSLIAIIALVKYYYKVEDLAEMLSANMTVFRNTSVFISNAIFALVYLIYKLIFGGTIRKKTAKSTFFEEIVNNFYTYDEVEEQWFLLKKWANFRSLLKALVIALTFSTVVILCVTWGRPRTATLMALVYPIASVIIMSEVFAFFNGITREEWSHDVGGEDAQARRVSNFFRIREILEKILPDPLLNAHISFNYQRKETPADYIKLLKESEENVDRVVAQYFEGENRYKTADLDCVKATHDIMRRKNVVFLNPFYRDLSMYIMLPIAACMLNRRKAVVITGKKSVDDDLKDWLTETVDEYSHIKSLWRVDKLDSANPTCDIGLLSFPELYNNDVIVANRKFFAEVDLVLFVEPSSMLNTGQIALSIIAQEMESAGNKPVYVIADRNVDGLVDTLSHVLHADMTTVVAPPTPKGIHTGMMWDANGDFTRQRFFDKQTKYLGNGFELAAIAVKNQIPEVTWYSESKVPVKDIRWIAGQYITSICRYMNIPIQQKSLEEKIKFSSNLWSSGKQKNSFVIAEDEYCNMFNTLKTFLSRGEDQAFVNVMSESYLLRDYMRCNMLMFLTNADAIPSIVPDYAKTERNTLVKLVLEMLYRPVMQDEVLDEFRLVGCESNDALGLLKEMLAKYTIADETIFDIKTHQVPNEGLGLMQINEFRVNHLAFNEFFAKTIEKAYYVVEHEEYGSEYIDAKMFGHVVQTLMPGQFVTYNGKYYFVNHISPQGGVVLRRASEHFDERIYYRQIRKYTIADAQPDELISMRKINDIEISWLRKDFRVETSGYLEMKQNHDLKYARIIDLSEDPNIDSYNREYRNKSVIRIKLPEADDRLCFTLSMLLQEEFRSIFPEAWPYIAVTTKRPDDIEGMLNYMVYELDGDVEDSYIYIIEDSDIDLGLLEAIEHNFMKFMEITADFLEWHFDKMRETPMQDPKPVSISVAMEKVELHEEEEEVEERKTRFQRIAEQLRKLFRRKTTPEDELDVGSVEDIETTKTSAEIEKEKATEKEPEASEVEEAVEVEEEVETAPETEAETTESEVEDNEAEADSEAEHVVAEADSEDPVVTELPENVMPADDDESVEESEAVPEADTREELDPELEDVDDTDIFEEENMSENLDDKFWLEDQFRAAGLLDIEPTRYQQECFLKFGFEEIDSRLKLDNVRKYLRVRGWTDNQYTKARTRTPYQEELTDLSAVNTCDFCGLPLTGVSYDALSDGRIRCNDCSCSAITTVEEFKELFYECKDMMEAFYNIKYTKPITVRTVDAREVAKGVGSIFAPSEEYAGRTLGYASKENSQFSLVMENGSPRLASIETMVHEMTHIWQYLNWNDKQILDIFGTPGDNARTAIARLIVYEGMAMWSSIQYLYLIGENYHAERLEIMTQSRVDPYGLGFIIFRDQYPFIKDSGLVGASPFKSFPPVEPAYVKTIADKLVSELEK